MPPLINAAQIYNQRKAEVARLLEIISSTPSASGSSNKKNSTATTSSPTPQQQDHLSRIISRKLHRRPSAANNPFSLQKLSSQRKIKRMRDELKDAILENVASEDLRNITNNKKKGTAYSAATEKALRQRVQLAKLTGSLATISTPASDANKALLRKKRRQSLLKKSRSLQKNTRQRRILTRNMELRNGMRKLVIVGHETVRAGGSGGCGDSTVADANNVFVHRKQSNALVAALTDDGKKNKKRLLPSHGLLAKTFHYTTHSGGNNASSTSSRTVGTLACDPSLALNAAAAAKNCSITTSSLSSCDAPESPSSSCVVPLAIAQRSVMKQRTRLLRACTSTKMMMSTSPVGASSAAASASSMASCGGALFDASHVLALQLHVKEHNGNNKNNDSSSSYHTWFSNVLAPQLHIEAHPNPSPSSSSVTFGTLKGSANFTVGFVTLQPSSASATSNPVALLLMPPTCQSNDVVMNLKSVLLRDDTPTSSSFALVGVTCCSSWATTSVFSASSSTLSSSPFVVSDVSLFETIGCVLDSNSNNGVGENEDGNDGFDLQYQYTVERSAAAVSKRNQKKNLGASSSSLSDLPPSSPQICNSEVFVFSSKTSHADVLNTNEDDNVSGNETNGDGNVTIQQQWHLVATFVTREELLKKTATRTQPTFTHNGRQKRQRDEQAKHSVDDSSSKFTLVEDNRKRTAKATAGCSSSLNNGGKAMPTHSVIVDSIAKVTPSSAASSSDSGVNAIADFAQYVHSTHYKCARGVYRSLMVGAKGHSSSFRPMGFQERQELLLQLSTHSLFGGGGKASVSQSLSILEAPISVSSLTSASSPAASTTLSGILSYCKQLYVFLMEKFPSAGRRKFYGGLHSSSSLKTTVLNQTAKRLIRQQVARKKQKLHRGFNEVNHRPSSSSRASFSRNIRRFIAMVDPSTPIAKAISNVSGGSGVMPIWCAWHRLLKGGGGGTVGAKKRNNMELTRSIQNIKRLLGVFIQYWANDGASPATPAMIPLTIKEKGSRQQCLVGSLVYGYHSSSSSSFLAPVGVVASTGYSHISGCVVANVIAKDSAAIHDAFVDLGNAASTSEEEEDHRAPPQFYISSVLPLSTLSDWSEVENKQDFVVAEAA